jgi:hypothetical protein
MTDPAPIPDQPPGAKRPQWQRTAGIIAIVVAINVVMYVSSRSAARPATSAESAPAAGQGRAGRAVTITAAEVATPILVLPDELRGEYWPIDAHGDPHRMHGKTIVKYEGRGIDALDTETGRTTRRSHGEMTAYHVAGELVRVECRRPDPRGSQATLIDVITYVKPDQVVIASGVVGEPLDEGAAARFLIR